MIGLILIYFIGRHFYVLAGNFTKNRWIYAILGVISYYSGTILFGFVLGISAELFGWYSIYELPDIAISVMSMPFGILSCWIFYTLLKKSWSAEPQPFKVDQQLINEFGRVEEDRNNE